MTAASPRSVRVKALSVRLPWAALIVSGRKTIELRTWSTNYRGPLVICVGMRPDPEGPGMPDELLRLAPAGYAVATVELVDVRPATEADTPAACRVIAAGELAWVLNGARRIRPFQVSGQLGLFEVLVPARRRVP